MGIHRHADSREVDLAFTAATAYMPRRGCNDNAYSRIRAAMLTKKGKYGLKALLHLAGMHPGQPALVSDIAAANNIPKSFLDAILGDLRNAGFVHSRKGKGGGYMLARAPGEIQLG